MHTEYRRLADEDLFWRKKSVRYIGMFIVVVSALLSCGLILSAVAQYPIQGSAFLAGLVAGILIGRASK